MSCSKIVNEGGLIESDGTVLNKQKTPEVQELLRAIKKHAKKQSEAESITNHLLSIRYQMESYLNDEDPEKVISTGAFLENLIKALRIKKKTLAEYIDYKESNLSAILKGRRKINIDLAIKFGEIFKVTPAVWLQIQTKNELLEILNRETAKYKKYSLEDLLEREN